MTPLEAERQLAEAVDRHREVLASREEPGRPESGQHVAAKAVDRADGLVWFALRQGAEAGVTVERLAEVSGREPGVVRDGLRAPS